MRYSQNGKNKSALRVHSNAYKPTRVIAYSGYRSEEYPKGFYLNNQYLEIVEIVDRWYAGTIRSDDPIQHYFKVRSVDGRLFLMKYLPLEDVWFFKLA